MKITSDDVRQVATLARLRLDADEERRLVHDLDAILGYVEQLNRLDTGDVPPTSHVLDVETPFREDRVTRSADVDALLQNAPDHSGGFFRVPKIIE